MTVLFFSLPLRSLGLLPFPFALILYLIPLPLSCSHSVPIYTLFYSLLPQFYPFSLSYPLYSFNIASSQHFHSLSTLHHCISITRLPPHMPFLLIDSRSYVLLWSSFFPSHSAPLVCILSITPPSPFPFTPSHSPITASPSSNSLLIRPST